MARAYVRRPKRYAGKRAPKRRTARRAPSTGSEVMALIKGAALGALKRRLGLNTETKYVDVAGTTTATGTLVLRIQPPTIAQGATVSQRNGAGVRITSVEQRISVNAAAAATGPSQLRIITVRHLHAGNPNPADILQTITDITSPLHNNLRANHIELIADNTYTLGTALSGNSSLYLQNTYSRANWQMEWTDADTTGVPANCINGVICTLWMIDNVSTAPVFTSTNRYWYVDN